MADTYPSIRTIWIQCKQHLKHKFSKAHVHLNNYFTHSLPNPDALYDLSADNDQLTFHSNFVDIIRNQSIDVITKDICVTTGAPVDKVNLKIKQHLDNSILTWYHGMDNTPLQKVSDIEYAFDTAATKTVTCVHLYINIDHLVFKHEFIPTDLSASGTDTTIDNQPTTPATPLPADTTNLLTPEFQKLIVNLAKATHNHPTVNSNSTPNATASGNNLPPISTQQLFNVSALPPDVRL